MGRLSRQPVQLPERRGRLIAILALGILTAPAPAATVQDGRYAMGTVLEITLEDPDVGAARAAMEEIFLRVAELEQLFTRFDPQSPVGRLNARSGEGMAAVDARVARILSDARALSALTRGSFDVTVGPLVALWQQAAREGRTPTPAALRETRSRVGAAGILVSPAGAVGLARPGMSVDLGGFAKGWALDRARELLRERGLEHAFLSFGESSLLGMGKPPDADGWRVLVRGPSGDYAGVVTLRDRSLSVSGSFGAWSEIGGRRYGHVLDPRTGWPVTRAAQAVVLAPGGALAEALSKALLVLEPAEAIALLEATPDVEGLLIEAGGAMRATAGFRDAAGWREFTGVAPDDRGRSPETAGSP